MLFVREYESISPTFECSRCWSLFDFHVERRVIGMGEPRASVWNSHTLLKWIGVTMPISYS
jgi:hypothetical protein